MILHLIRHPRPIVAAGTCYGRRDVAAENPAPAAERLRAVLPAGLPVWSSPSRRCLALAQLLADQPVADARLMEMNFGDWEGRPWDDIPRDQLDAWAADIAGYAPPGGESPLQVQARVLDFVAELRVPAAVLVTHAGVIRMLLARQRGLTLAQSLKLDIPYASHTVIDWLR